uniref:Uncharacterized protein n=1 Tax=Percolomonas cosmopolitus TaxID=63605 RepID=A0A7S1PIL5_9EUKA|eukprot:CAMPEP_0117441000 /NCGR_PEP_ID=MMETSP0759-20121206/3391_1 /TAXON_ID=63605 /ORGANISM="Percolomonas cosmopolitus, Strain WS" /LENGTH=671 /DNA_ID=CAMNT_0005232805 /DNA_START=362 /DNA_END=2377 /DNA_ORIENTATION=-
MTNTILLILDLLLFEEHLDRTEKSTIPTKEVREFIHLVSQMSPLQFDATPCFNLLMSRGYHNQALRIAEKHYLSKQLVEFHVVQSAQGGRLPAQHFSDSHLYSLLNEVKEDYCNGAATSTTLQNRATVFPLVKQCCDNEPVRLINWIHYCSSHPRKQESVAEYESPSQPLVSELMSIFPLVSRQKSSPELLAYFENWCHTNEHTVEVVHHASTSTTSLTSPAKHSCAAAMMCIKEYLSRKNPAEMIRFLGSVEQCDSCVNHILRKVTTFDAQFTELHIQNDENAVSSEDKTHLPNPELQTIFNKVSCMHVAALCCKYQYEWQMAVQHLAQGAALLLTEINQNLPHVDLERRYLLSLAAKFANLAYGSASQEDDETNSEATADSHEKREKIWHLLIDELCRTHEAIQSSKRKMSSFASDLASFFIVPPTERGAQSRTPLSVVTRIVSLLPPETVISSVKTNLLEYCNNVSQEMREIKAETEAHAMLHRELKQMASSYTHSHFQIAFKSREAQCCSPYCQHDSKCLVEKVHQQQDEPVFVFTFSCAHHFHSTCIEQMILSYPSHEEIIRRVEEDGVDIRAFPVRHSLTKLTLQQLNRRNLFFERAAVYARGQVSWLTSSHKHQTAIFKRCLKQLVIMSKKHQLFKHECPICGGLYVASILKPFEEESRGEWGI